MSRLMQYIIRFLAFAALSLVAGCAAEVEFTKNPDALSAYQRSRQASMEGLHTDALRNLQTAYETMENYTMADMVRRELERFKDVLE